MILTADQIRARVDADWPQILGVVEDRIALRPISAHGINGEHMRKSAEYVANKLREVGVDAKAVQARDKDGNPSAWEVIGSLEVNPNAPTVLLYAHHDVQPVPDEKEWDTAPFEATLKGDRLYGRGACDDAGGIAIHYGALRALGDQLGVNIKVFIEGE